MNIDTVKVELIDWIARLEDQNDILKVLSLKKRMTSENAERGGEIFGSGKDLVKHIAENFNDPLDSFKEYQK